MPAEFSAAVVSPPPDLSADEALAGRPDPVPPDMLATTQLADLLGRASTNLFDYRRDHPSLPASDLDRMLDLESRMDRRAIDLRSQAIQLLGGQADQALAQLKDATARVDAFLSDLKTIDARFALAGDLLTLAGAAVAGDASGVLSAVGDLRSTLRALPA